MELEADSESKLEELSSRLKVAFDLRYDDMGNHKFCFEGHVYVPGDMLDAVREVSFETWDPDDTREEPDWYELYRSSDDITLSEAFTVLGSAIKYKQGFNNELLITLVGREDDPANPNERFEKYDYLQDEF